MSASFMVTGVAGFIGSHISAALLARGDSVIGVDNFDPFYDRKLKLANVSQLAPDRFELIELDIRDAHAMRELFDRTRPDGVFHIAALAGVRPSINDPARYASVNVDGLVSVLEAARACDCQHFIFASSSSVYGNNTKVPFAETDPVDEPISPYAATKRAGELICHTYTRLFGISIACLRFFTVYGPAQRPDLAIGKFMRLIADDQPVPMFGDGSTSRDYTYIDDIIQGVLAAYEFIRSSSLKPHASPLFRIFNLGGSQPVSLRDMIEAVGAVVGNKPRIEQLPMQVGDVQRTFADLSRSREALGFDPQTPFEDGLRKQWAWLRDRLELFAPAAP
ncbi:MAG: NAD-dependent epimerase/dehydratase family protein [Phycisphaerales bacterium]